ncbi:hypothetical protein F8388_015434 [Cannabis sativa]|uniref:Uncharacterized protein n=1 Tax=Cannabis sativa TaxID=3483 RepID=A0A7J6GI35_CANSA|nr:hypothetical protein F8388_015434 [Cannabis sativa]
MEIQGPLRLLHPNGLIRAMELAESIEANQILVRNYKTGSNRLIHNRPSSLSMPETRVPHVISSPTYSTTSVNSKTTSASSSSSPTSFKRFTEVELREKKERGVCFKCDGRWFRGHECKEAELVVVVVQDEAQEEPPDDYYELHSERLQELKQVTNVFDRFRGQRWEILGQPYAVTSMEF